MQWCVDKRTAITPQMGPLSESNKTVIIMSVSVASSPLISCRGSALRVNTPALFLPENVRSERQKEGLMLPPVKHRRTSTQEKAWIMTECLTTDDVRDVQHHQREECSEECADPECCPSFAVSLSPFIPRLLHSSPVLHASVSDYFDELEPPFRSRGSKPHRDVSPGTDMTYFGISYVRALSFFFTFKSFFGAFLLPEWQREGQAKHRRTLSCLCFSIHAGMSANSYSMSASLRLARLAFPSYF